MIPSRTVRENTGLSQRRLSYMSSLGLLPHATRIPTIGHRGSTCVYPPTIFTRLRVIKFLQGHGFTLTQIVRAARGTPFECLDPDP